MNSSDPVFEKESVLSDFGTEKNGKLQMLADPAWIPEKPGVRILVVDDDSAVRQMLCQMCTAAGYTAHGASGSGEAQEKLIASDYELMLLDAKLPGVSGLELLRFCKHHHPLMEIIMITGNPELSDAVSTVKNGAFDYLAKPFSMKLLLSRIREALIHRSGLLKEQETKEASTEEKEPLSKTQPVHPDRIRMVFPLPGYRAVRCLGCGENGVVVLVEKDGQKYALKLIRRGRNSQAWEQQIGRFLREAEILQKMNHPNIVKIVHAGFAKETEMPYLLMEHLEGVPLSRLISADSLTVMERIHIIRQIAQAVKAIHAVGVLHRDIKPENIIITSSGRAVLTDFGIARVEDSALTMTHETLGSPAYMPPEAFDIHRPYTAESDLFSLGVLSYELLTGKRPFTGENIPAVMD